MSGINALAVAGTTYNFTNMPPQQLLNAGSQLFESGAITGPESGVLMGLACDYTAGPGQQLPANLGLNSTTGQDYLQVLQTSIADLESLGGLDAGEQNGLTNAKGLLQVFESYQSANPTSSLPESSGTLVNQQV